MHCHDITARVLKQKLKISDGFDYTSLGIWWWHATGHKENHWQHSWSHYFEWKIPRWSCTSTTDPNEFLDSPIPFQRLQFPIRLAFAMTINKSQGQTMTFCGLDLENLCFSHGQLYVACSRVGKPSNLFVYTPEGLPKNIVR